MDENEIKQLIKKTLEERIDDPRDDRLGEFESIFALLSFLLSKTDMLDHHIGSIDHIANTDK